ncbi:hypothetical protein [Amycolatopsis sp. NPDC004625]|uniref:hypothetical protein n=1 Tax=Amycolatopsis sp. NPDC004625 TaxID=3154670 RepID=UPI0033B2139B
MPIYKLPGNTQIGSTTGGPGIVNVDNSSGDWRHGNFYWIDGNGGANWYDTGWIHLSHVHYVRCW